MSDDSTDQIGYFANIYWKTNYEIISNFTVEISNPAHSDVLDGNNMGSSK